MFDITLTFSTVVLGDTTLQKPVDLIGQKLERPFPVLRLLNVGDSQSGAQDIIGVHASFAVEGSPDESGQIEAHGLPEQDKLNVLVISQ